jgi:hypothetical protein
MRSLDSKGRRHALHAVAVVLAGAAAAAGAWAEQPPASGDRIVARFTGREIPAAELERQMARSSPMQLRVLGKSAEQIRRSFLDLVLATEVLAAGARAEGLDRSADIAERRQSLLASALLAAVRTEVGDGGDIPDAELQAFFDANKERYQGDRAIQLWQIVVESKEKAAELIAELRNDPAASKDPARRWGELAEQHSVDEATKHRQGNLGFVRPDGMTDRPGERLSPALYAAADKVADGELVAEPIGVGGRWVVLQRRAKRERAEVGFENLKGHLRAQIVQQRIEQRVADLKKSLRQQQGVQIYPDSLELLEVRRDLDGEVVAARRPGGLPRERRPAVASPRPVGPPGQLR